LQFGADPLEPRLHARALFVGERLHFRIAAEFVRRLEIGFCLHEFVKARDDGIDVGMLFRERAIAVHVARRILRGEQVIQLGEPR